MPQSDLVACTVCLSRSSSCGQWEGGLYGDTRAGRGLGSCPWGCRSWSSASLSPPFLRARAAISRDPFYEMLAARKKKVSSTRRH